MKRDNMGFHEEVSGIIISRTRDLAAIFLWVHTCNAALNTSDLLMSFSAYFRATTFT
jgi:hypothetical protein